MMMEEDEESVEKEEARRERTRWLVGDATQTHLSYAGSRKCSLTTAVPGVNDYSWLP